MSNKRKNLVRLVWSSLIALLVSTLLWYVMEIPLLEKLPVFLYNSFRIPLYGVQQLDVNGVPYMVYPETGKQYNPLMVANQALIYSKNLHSESNHIGFVHCTDWLAANLKIEDNKANAYYGFPVQKYNLKPPWSSALAQSTILSALYIRYQISNDEKWLLLSRQVLETFRPGQSKFVLELNGNSIWFEEYPSAEPSYVLNGMLSVVIDLHRYYFSTSDTTALILFQKGYNAVLEKLPDYDDNFISRYDLQGSIASMAYHQMHINLLKELDTIKPNPIMNKYIKKWKLYRLVPAPIQLVFNFKPRRCIAFCSLWLCLTFFTFLIILIMKVGKPQRKF